MKPVVARVESGSGKREIAVKEKVPMDLSPLEAIRPNPALDDVTDALLKTFRKDFEELAKR